MTISKLRKLLDGCKKKTSAKYTSRPGPPYAAQECRGLYQLGNDGYTYQSVGNVNGIYRWKKLGVLQGDKPIPAKNWHPAKRSTPKRKTSKRKTSKRKTSKRKTSKKTLKRKTSKKTSKRKTSSKRRTL